MDNPVEWSPPRPVGVALVGGGVVLLAAAALSGSDPPGLVIMGIAGLLLVGMGLGSLLIRPKLAASPDTLEIRTITGRRTYPRAAVHRVRIVSYPRFGRRVPNLEIDIVDASGDDRLVILGRWELGEHPSEVADVLDSQGYPVAEDKTLRLRARDDSAYDGADDTDPDTDPDTDR